MDKNKKSKMLKDLKFCKELMDRLLEQAEKCNDSESAWCMYGHTVVENDIIRLRRELNNVRKNIESHY